MKLTTTTALLCLFSPFSSATRAQANPAQEPAGDPAAEAATPQEETIVVELVDNDLTQWSLERFEEGGGDRPFDATRGTFEGPKLGEHLRKSGAVAILGAEPGVAVRPGSAPEERAKASRERVATHKVVVRWEPIVVQSLVQRPNRARPTNGPRPESIHGGAVQVSLRIDDLAERTVLLDESFAVTLEGGPGDSLDRRDGFVTRLAGKAKATVAAKVFFALRPPTVVRKWAGQDGHWFVEARIARGVAEGFEAFAVGNDGSLADPDWQAFATATLVGGTATSCTFRLTDVVDASRIEPDRSQVRPQL